MGLGEEGWVLTSQGIRAFSLALLWPSPLGALVPAAARTDWGLVAGGAGEECSLSPQPSRCSQTKTRKLLGAEPGWVRNPRLDSGFPPSG